MEAVVDVYHSKLFASDAQNKGLILAKFFSELFELPLSAQNIVMFNKLLKLYGAEDVFFATLSSFESGADPSKIYGLLSYICKKKLAEKQTKANSIDLQGLVDEYTEKASKNRKLKIRSPFDE